MNQSLRKWLVSGYLKIRQLANKVGFVRDRINEDAPMFQNSLMAHALGGYHGHTYCNTLAAFEHAAQNGYRYFEVDLSYTEDDRLVLCHGWSEQACRHTDIPYSPAFKHMTYRDIMQKKVFGEKICDARTFYREIKDLPYWFEIDFHRRSGEPLTKRIHSLLVDFENNEEVLDRLVIQVYSQRMYRDIESVHHFRFYQYLVGEQIDELDEILFFCLRNGICSLAIRTSDASPEVIARIKSMGLHVLCYTVKENAADAKKFLDRGADTVCTDFVTPAQLEKLNTEQE